MSMRMQRKCYDIRACQSCYGNSLQAEISKSVMRMVCHCDQDDRKPDGAVLWNSMGPKLLKAFQKWTKFFRTRIDFDTSMKEVTK